jgi:hypothetical protein
MLDRPADRPGTRPGPRANAAGSLNGLQIVVSDIETARAQLIANGVDVSEVLEVVHEEDASAYRPVTGDPIGWNAYVFFSDPDGNGWILQQSPPPDG